MEYFVQVNIHLFFYNTMQNSCCHLGIASFNRIKKVAKRITNIRFDGSASEVLLNSEILPQPVDHISPYALHRSGVVEGA